jgi:hypothetical protein
VSPSSSLSRPPLWPQRRRAHARALMPISVPVHPRMRVRWVRGKVGPLAPLTLAPRPSTRSPRRRGFCRADALVHARAQGNGGAFRVPREIPPSSGRVPLDAAGRGRLFPSAAVNTNPSSAMAESPCATGIRGKSPDLWNVLASPVSHA